MTPEKRTEKALVVDDNPMNRDLIIAILEEKNLDYDQAESGEEALKLLDRGEYWIAFIDLLMPGINGFDTIRKMRQSGLLIPIIAVSAISFKQDRQAAFEAGCDDFIPKPVDVDRLNEVIAFHDQRYQELKEKGQQEHRPLDSQIRLRKSAGPGSTEIDLSGTHVMLVEENEKTRQQFSNSLQNRGFKVQTCENGADAWQQIGRDEEKPRIIVSNIHMPEIDGLGLLAMVKREYPFILFFLYSPSFDAKTIQLASREGVDGIVFMDRFEETVFDIIASTLDKTESRNSGSAVKKALYQVRRAQEEMMNLGCDPPCDFCDVSYAALHEAGGDTVSCRRFNLEGRCGAVLVDVAGHDILSSYLSAIFWGILSSYWNNFQKPSDLAQLLNEELFRIGFNNSHLCLTAILWDPIRRKLEVTIAGNPGGLLIRQKNGEIEVVHLEGGGMVIGMLPENNQMVHHQFELDSEATFLFHSDGLDSRLLGDIIENSETDLTISPLDISSQRILEKYLARHGQEDDMILMRLKIPDQDGQAENRLSTCSDYKEIDRACDWLEKKLSGGFLPRGACLSDISLGCREALLNAVEHGNDRDPARFIDLTLTPIEKGLEVRISDEGPGYNLKEKTKENSVVNGLQIGNRGLLLMQSLADSIEVRGGSVILTFLEK